jgi:signal transduction histidine kinase
MNRNPETHRGRGLGIVYARRLADTFEVETSSNGTSVLIQKNIPAKNNNFNKLIIAGWLKQLTSEPTISAYEELKLRNSQLVELTEELKNNGRMVDKQMVEIRQLNLQLSEKNERMKEFTYAISHDLKNPLSSLKMAAEHLSSNSQDAELSLYYGVLSRSVNRLEKTINGLVEILDIQNQAKHIRRELELEQFFEDTKDEYAALIKETNATIEADFSAAPQISYIEGYLHSLFHNMISNSLKYKHPKKTPLISISSRKAEKHIELTFTDNGIGMDLEKIHDKLFLPFHRFSEKPDGKGIGLFLIKGMVESNGGKVSVNSELDKGTTFVFELIPYQ